MKNLILVLSMAIVWGGVVARADAAGVLRLSDGISTVVVADGDAEDMDSASGAVTYFGPVGANGVLALARARTQPLVGASASPRLEMDVECVTVFGSTPLSVAWTDTGFGPLAAGQGFTASAAGSAEALLIGLTVSTWGDAGDVAFGDDGETAQSVLFFDSAVFGGTTPAPQGGPLAGPYSLTIQAVVQHLGFGESMVSAVLEADPVADNAPPVAVVQDVFVEAGPDCTGLVSPAQVDAGSHDPDGDDLELSLHPPGPYGLGETLVTLTVSDGMGGEDSAMALVTVLDGTPPTILCPDPITVGAHAEIPPPDPASIAAYDHCGIAQVIFLGDASDGLTNPETITRTYLAMDDSGNTAECTQAITVAAPSAVDLLAALIADTKSMPLPRGIRNALLAKLQNAQCQLLAGQTRPAENLLRAFIQQVRALRGKQLNPATADALVARAKAVLDAIPSPTPPRKGRDSRIDSPHCRP